MLIAVLLVIPALSFAQDNLLPNPSFELVEPPRPTADQARLGALPPLETWLPRTWTVWSNGDAEWRCPANREAAHGGQRYLHLTARQGRAAARYGPIPVSGPEAWTVRFWACGTGQLTVSATDATAEPWRDQPLQTFDLQAQWTELALTWTPPAACRQWCLTIATEGAAEARVDEVLLTGPQWATPPWPPPAPVAADEHTLLYLDFEQPLDEDAFYVGGQVGYTSEDNQEGFGRALRLGAGAYVACSADEHLNPKAGTIELWCKLLEPGDNGVQQPMVSIPGPEGLWLGKDQYSHVGLQFSTGWSRLSGAIAMGYAWAWQPCWRHVAACWDEQALTVFVDGKLIAWEPRPKLSRFLGPELRLGSPGMLMDDLRISDVVRYRVPLPAD
ncbi:MAG: hypothetical protein HPY69_02300 [Armatimonadetes bacterium]|nr:hypothetical protein [Armatimonadota bacterium]